MLAMLECVVLRGAVLLLVVGSTVLRLEGVKRSQTSLSHHHHDEDRMMIRMMIIIIILSSSSSSSSSRTTNEQSAYRACLVLQQPHRGCCTTTGENTRLKIGDETRDKPHVIVALEELWLKVEVDGLP
jgi:hypothetical protein